MNVDNTEDLTHVSLCTGYGGIDIGLKRVIGSVRTIAYSEIEAYAITNLIAKMEAGLLDSAPIWPNLKTFPFKEFYNKVDILSGGFPCQPFSSGGRRKADNDPRHLFPYIKQGIQQCKPRIVFLENVEGIISSKLKGDEWNDPEDTPVLLHILRELERVGYQATAGIFSASETGAPHQRKRVFIMGISNDLPKSERTRVLAMLKPITATAYPSGRNEEQYDFEPARVIIENEPRKPPLGRNVNGSAGGVVYGDLSQSYDSPVDEMRLLGNGVVPDVASNAFKVMWVELCG